nr:fimbrial protein [uncultured Enterobacter sp.]
MTRTKTLRLFALPLALAVCPPAMAIGTATLDVTFTATLRETTCDMQIAGGTGDGQSNTIPIGNGGKTQLDAIIKGTEAATAAFTLKIIDCPQSLGSLKTTLTGTPSVHLNTALANTAVDNPALEMGVSIARASLPDAPFVINATDDSQRLVWNASEINGKAVSLIARLVETLPGAATTGNFSTIATFNFEYE